MVAGNWLNQDGLYLEFGTTKAVNETAGEYRTPGEFRVIEIDLDLTTLTTTDAVISNTQFFPPSPTGTTQNLYVEQVEVLTEVGMTASGATSFNVGLISSVDRTTVISSTAFVNAMTNASVTTSGQKLTLVNGSSFAGGYIGVPPNNAVLGYISAKSTAGTYTAGKVKVRIKYFIFGSITQ